MVAVAEMRDQLLSVDEIAEIMGETEPLSEIEFSTSLDPDTGGDGQCATFDIAEDWHEDAPEGTEIVNATVQLGGQEYRLTKDALLEATSFMGLPKVYMERTPADLMVPHVNYWFRHKGRDLKALAADDVVHAFAKQTVVPFSNLQLLEKALESIKGKYGSDADVLADYKFHHTLRRTHFRLIVPEELRAMRPDDEWSAGVDVQNSLVGEVSTSLQGYLFRWWCTNGSTTNLATTPAWNRKRKGGEEGTDVYSWARETVDEILGHLDHEFEAVQNLTTTPIDGDVNDVLADVFETYRIPVGARANIIEEMVNSDDLTMYGLMQAITMSANGDDLTEPLRQTLMSAAGELPHAFSERCSNCRRLPLDR